MLESITANVADLDKYWSEQDFKKNPQLKMAATFWTSFDVQNELPIPLLLHGDHASFSETDSMLVVSMRCVISDKAACLPKEATTGSTWKPIYLGCHNCQPDCTGKRPPPGSESAAEAGNRYGGCRRFGIFRCRIWVAYREFQLPLPFLQGRQLFNEDKKVAPFNDFRPTAAWRALPRTPPNNGHQLLSVPAVNC